MKHTLILALIVLFSSSASAQDVCPEFANMVSVISEDGKSSKELSLERAVAKQKKKGIYRGYDNSVRLEGATAKVSVKSRQKFAFKPINPQVHPAQQIKLGCYEVSSTAPLPAGEYAFSLGGQGSSADVAGTAAGYGSTTQGQTWFGFSVK